MKVENPLEVNKLNKKGFRPMKIDNEGMLKKYIVNSDVKVTNPLHRGVLI